MVPRLYRIIEHPADIGFEVRGSTCKKLFESAAQAFFQILWRIDATVQSRQVTIEVAGRDLEELLVNFLEEFIYLYDAKGLVCTKIQILEQTDKTICARTWLRKYNLDRDQELLVVKAVTYHQLYIGKENNTWVARIFLDI